MRTNRCYKCRGKTRKAERIQKWTVGGTEYSVPVPARECVECDEVVLDGPSLIRAELTVAAEVARTGTISRETFRFMRRAIGMRAVDLAELLDVEPETISHWETGRSTVPRAAWVVMRDLVLDAVSGRATTKERLQEKGRPRARVSLPLLALGGLALFAAARVSAKPRKA